MFPIPSFLYKWIAIGAVILLLGIGLKIQTARLDAVKKEYAEFVAKVKAIGEAQEAKNKAEEEQRNTISKRKEVDYGKRIKDLSAKYADARRLLDANSGSSQVGPLSAAASIISCPDRQADTAGRLERLESGVLAILERGDKAIERTIACKGWLDEQTAVK